MTTFDLNKLNWQKTPKFAFNVVLFNIYAMNQEKIYVFFITDHFCESIADSKTQVIQIDKVSPYMAPIVHYINC